MLRVSIYILVVAAIFAPLLASVNIVLPRQVPETFYLEALIAAAFALVLWSLLTGQLRFPKVGVLGIAVAVWAVAASWVSWDALPLAFGALFFILQALILHEEEWIRLLRLFTWIGVLLTWPVFFGQAGKIVLQQYAPFFVPMVALAAVFARRERTQLARWWFGLAALLLMLVLVYVYAEGVDEFRFLRPLWMMRITRAFSSPEHIAVAAAAALVWIAAFFTVGKIAVKKTATLTWIVGLSGAFAAMLATNPFFSGWMAATLAFVVLAALAEWVAHAEQRPPSS